MLKHIDLTDEELRKRIKNRWIVLAGNRRLKIYGRLGCTSGKRMKRENRVFFTSEDEAIEHGFRPCANCLNDRYKAGYDF